MPDYTTATSTLGKKILMGLTGVALFTFVAGHLAENLLLLAGPDIYNNWAHTLTSLGVLLYGVEALLVAAFLVHVVIGISVTLSNRKARPVSYAVTGASRGNPSHMNVYSRTMIWSGLVLLVFVIIHVKTLKFGPDVTEGYVAVVNGQEVRDLYRLVVEVFSYGPNVVWYVGVMLFLGFHLRHGFWSALQSLGVSHPRYTPLIYLAGGIAALALAIGFVFLPVWIFFSGGVS